MGRQMARLTHVTRKSDTDTHERVMPVSSDRSKVLTQGDQCSAIPMNPVGAWGQHEQAGINYSDSRS
jgi:hypothetical protein